MTRHMRRIFIWIAVWSALCVATMAIRSLRLARSISAAPVVEQEEDAKSELNAMIQKNHTPLFSDIQESYPELASAISNAIMNQAAALRKCGRTVVARTLRPTEYFELSFAFSEVRIGSYRLSQAEFERSTIAFSEDEQRCVLDVVEGLTLQVAGTNTPLGRVAYQFCFSRNGSKDGD